MMMFIALLVATRSVSVAGGTLDENFRLAMSSANYQGSLFHMFLDFYQNPALEPGVYWRASSIANSLVNGVNGGTIDANLNINDLEVFFNGARYLIDLSFFDNPLDPGWPYWQLSSAEALPGSIQTVTGPTLQQFQAMVPCLTNCLTSMNLECLLNCIGGFSINLQVNNPTGENIEIYIPPGSVFQPADSQSQPMMILDEQVIIAPPGDFTINLPAYCLADDLAPPGIEDVYSFGVAASAGCLLEIINLTAGKNLDGAEQSRVQEIVWTCIETNGISAEDQTWLEGL